MERSAIAGRRPATERLGLAAARVLRSAADPRLALATLLLAAVANLAATAPALRSPLTGPTYLALLGLVLLTGLAGLAVRLPAAWREWRTPGPLPDRGDLERRTVPLERALDARTWATVVERLRRAGYRAHEPRGGARRAVHGTARGASRLAALASHLAVVLLVVGAGIGGAFGAERTFTLLPGDQAGLGDGPRTGNEAVRLEAFDARFGPDGRPERLDTTVTFLRGGHAERRQRLRVNEPGSFAGWTVHAWTYGPAARLRVTTLDGRPLLDGGLALDRTIGGAPGAFAELPAAGITLGLRLESADAGALRLTAADSAGTLDSAVLRPGVERRLGGLVVRLEGFDAYVTFLSRNDPGFGVVLAGAALLVLSLAAAFYLPRRRVSVVAAGSELRLALRAERFDPPGPEAERLAAILRAAVR